MADREFQGELESLRRELAQARRMLDDQQRLVGLGSWERDLDTGETHWSDETFRIHGFEPQSFVPDSNASGRLTIAEDVEKRLAWHRAVEAANGEEVQEVIRIRLETGEERTLRGRAVVITDPASGRRRMVGTVQNITDEVRIKDAELLLSQIVQSASQAIFTYDPDRLVTSWNPACERLYGYSAAEVIGTPIRMLLPDDTTDAERERIAETNRQLLSGEQASSEYEARRRRRDGTIVHVAVKWDPLRDSRGEIVGTIVSVTDITERKREEARARHLANHDPLTGLLNRRGFEEALERAIAEGWQGAVVMLDLDNFKYINEIHGHKIGDTLVAELALALNAKLSEQDLLARLGGDEFGVLTAAATLEQAEQTAERLLEAVREHVMDVDGVPVRTSASIGVTGSRGPCDPTELLADADRAMYASKEAGRDRITVLSQVERQLARTKAQTAGEHMIRSALAEDRFELYVHPIVNLTTGVMTHCEVLLRMRSESGELVSPGEFLPTAERLGLIHLIDYWVIEHALAQVPNHPDLTFEINLSGATIDDTGLEAFIACQLERHKVDPTRVVFELTETTAVSNLARARDLATRLSELGCMFAIDDFGTGFSTFYYLKHFPAKYVKIDGEFMADTHSRLDELVIESIVRIGREVGKLTIAEYVSDHAALERARNLGVDYGQGYYFAKPFPISELAAMPRVLLDVSESVGRQTLYSTAARVRR